MSSEESNCEEDGTFLGYKITRILWESRKLRKRKEKLDKMYDSIQSQRALRRRVRKNRDPQAMSSRPCPDNCPEWACHGN